MKDLMAALSGKIAPRDWYEWRVQNWGTKWEPSGVDVEKGVDHILYDFDTAWSPPEPWVRSISTKYPDLTFRLSYEEPGNDFEGHVLVKDGAILEEYNGNYSKCIYCSRPFEDCVKNPCEDRKEETKET